jgi:hypothetical protein
MKKKIKYIIKLYYVRNHIMFDFFYNFNFFNKVNGHVKVKDGKYLGMEGVAFYGFSTHFYIGTITETVMPNDFLENLFF